MNDDLISRSALKKAVENLVVGGEERLKEYYENGSKSEENEWIGGVYDVWEQINDAPSVDFEKLGESLRCQIRAEYGSCDDCELSCPRNELIKLLDSERQQGKWIKFEAGRYTKFYKCSLCGRVINTIKENPCDEYPFCHCGADMRGGRE